MLTLSRRLLAFLVISVGGLLLLFSTTPRAMEKASSLKAAHVPWGSEVQEPSRSSAGSSHPSSQKVEHTAASLPDTRITPTILPPGTQASGFTFFERLYVYNGTLYAVIATEEERAAFPSLVHVLSKPKDKGTGENIDPTEREMRVIGMEEAKAVLGTRAVVVEGVSIMMYDTKQFMAHYYHWWGEIILGAMRVYSALSFLPEYKDSPLPEIARFILPNVIDKGWHDKAGVNAPLMRAGFPSAGIERIDFWEDLMDVDQTFVFEKVMLVSRVAAHKHPLSSVWYKMISSTMNLTAVPQYWEPLRQRVVHNVVGYLPIPGDSGAILAPKTAPIRPGSSVSKSNPATKKIELSHLGSKRPLVVYVSRQGAGRRLTDADNKNLEAALRGLEEEGVCEVYIARMEELALAEQIEVVGRSTVMLGVHGNGLTHQIWMPVGERSTVIEIFYPETYLHDYSMLARNMGHKHYAIWNDTSVTYPDGQWYEGVNGGTRETFHGNSIPVHGPTVADIIRKRLTEDLDM